MNEGLSADHREMLATLEALAQRHPFYVQHALAGSLAYIYCAGQPLRERLRIAWKILRS